MRAYMTKRNCSIFVVLALIMLAVFLYGRADTVQTPLSSPAISTYTNIDTESCETHTDSEDPDEIPYLVCPGVLGYTLRVQSVDSGRKSIDVIDPGEEYFSLAYEDVITRSFSHLDNIAEWRTAMVGTEDVPIALIVTVLAHENDEEPDQVTHSYHAVAKITEGEICVTDRILKDSISVEELHSLADTARERPCLDPLPTSDTE